MPVKCRKGWELGPDGDFVTQAQNHARKAHGMPIEEAKKQAHGLKPPMNTDVRCAQPAALSPSSIRCFRIRNSDRLKGVRHDHFYGLRNGATPNDEAGYCWPTLKTSISK